MAPPLRIAIRERPSLRLNILTENPEGYRQRWGQDNPNPIYAFKDLSFSTVMPGGFERMNCTLERDPQRSYVDTKELTRTTVLGNGGSVYFQGRIEKLPDVGGFEAQETPEAVGYQAALEDNNSAREIYVDRELSAWQGASTQRKINLLNGGVDTEDASVEASAGTESTAANPSLATRITGEWSRERTSEGWYDAKGIPIGALQYAWELTAEGKIGQGLTTDTNWQWAIFLSSDEIGSSIDGSGNLLSAGPTGTGGLEPTTKRTWAGVQLTYLTGPTGAQGAIYPVYWTVLSVIGTHGLTSHGSLTTREAAGFLASDIVGHAIRTWAPEISFSQGTEGTIRPTTFIIPQATFLEPTTVAEIIKQVTRFELPDWAVWESEAAPFVPTFYMNPRGERGRRWKARVGPAQLQETGPQISRLWNGVVVQYTDVTGKQRMVGPPGYAGAAPNTEDSTLLETDPENPLNELGIKKWAGLKMGTSTREGAKQVGRIFLREQSVRETSGQASLVGHVEDIAGNYWPAAAVRGGDQITFVDAADTSERRIVSTSYDDTAKTNTIQLDQPSDQMQALLERLSVELVPLGLT